MSNGVNGVEWRFLIVEDDEDKIRQLQEIAPSCVDEPDTVSVDVCDTFSKAAGRLKSERFDLLILDLKDSSDNTLEADSSPAGLAVFEQLKKTRFVPVVFYTALAHKVRSEETSFVRVVEKTESITKVREEVRRVLATKLPLLMRHLEELQRTYMWGFVATHWKDFELLTDQADIAYLLGRRLAISLEAEAGELAVRVGGVAQARTADTKAHPMAMYVIPPMEPPYLAGDIVSEIVGNDEQFWIILTPSCDFVQCKANHVTLAKCERLDSRVEYAKWLVTKDIAKSGLQQLIEDRRGDRFKFLPGAFFIPGLVVDFQQLRSISLESIGAFKRIATLDSPFAESVMARVSRYFNRLGTPDVDTSVVMKRLEGTPAPN